MRWIQGGGTIDGVKNLLKMGEDRKKSFHFTVNASSQKLVEDVEQLPFLEV